MNYSLMGSELKARAFLRWAGGKTWLTPRLQSLFPRLTFNRYHEPFLGGGSVFFTVAAGTGAYLSDSNNELIETFCSIRDDVGRVIDIMRSFENTEQRYYEIRASAFSCPHERAAAFIFLNQTSFNGIYRVNLNGIYNVPYGGRQKRFLDEDALLRASIALRRADIRTRDFDETLDDITEGDLVFVDPPYTVTHNNNGFIKYNKSLFAIEDQYRLADYVQAVLRKGANYILTNAAHPSIEDIFALGGHRIELSRASLIGGKRAHRGAVTEYLFSNLEIAGA